MAGAKDQEGQIVTLDKLRDQAVVISQKVLKGEITPQAGNVALSGYRTAAYIEQVRLSQEAPSLVQEAATELSQADRERLDEIAKLLSDKPKKRGGKKREGL